MTAELLKGLKRLPKEHFSVYVGKRGQAAYLPVPSGPWSYFADPFIWQHKGELWLLVEEFEYLKNRGRLRCMLLDESFNTGASLPLLNLDCHASFPFVFAHGDELYMIPETSHGQYVDLYVCENFPLRWRRAARLLDGVDAADTVILQHDQLWWLITSVRQDRQKPARFLSIYFCEDFLRGPWQAHPVNAARKFDGTRYSTGRNGGAIIRHEGNLLRLAQDNRDYYGQSIRVMKIDQLTTAEFSESPYDEHGLLTDISRRFSPHHISVHGDFIAFDIRDRVSYLQYVPYFRKAIRCGRLSPQITKSD